MVADQVLTDEQLGNYEMVVVFSPELDDEALEAALGNITRLITDKGGTVAEVDKWGKRRLAYPIKHASEGIYVLLKCQLKPDTGRALETYMRISEEILRYLLIKLNTEE